MRQRNKQAPQSAEETVRDIRRATRRHFSAEEKIRIVLDGLRGEDSIAELCRKEGIGCFYYAMSDDLIDGLGVAGLQLADEQVVEAFYNYFITPWLRLTGDIQWIDTGRDDLDDAVLTAVRLQTRF